MYSCHGHHVTQFYKFFQDYELPFSSVCHFLFLFECLPVQPKQMLVVYSGFCLFSTGPLSITDSTRLAYTTNSLLHLECQFFFFNLHQTSVVVL